MKDDDDEKDYEVGYGRPPKATQIKKGERRNPNGRRGKNPKPKSVKTDAEIISQIDSEMVKVRGRWMTKRELEIRLVQAKSLQADMKSHQVLDRLRKSVKPVESVKRSGGVLLVPTVESFEQWSAAAAIQQAKFRGEDPDGLAKLNDRDQDD